MAKIFITGIAGFLGSHLAETLLAQGHVVWGCDSLLGGVTSNVPAGANWYHLDCRNREAMLGCMKGMDIVYHCAAAAHEGLSVFSPAFIFDNVAGGSISVFSAAIAAGVKRIVFLSSMARYGRGLILDQDNPGLLEMEKYQEYVWAKSFHEDFIPAPADPYGHAKVASENVLRTLCELHGVQYQIAVPHNIIGTRQCYTDPYRNVISIWINRLKQGKPGIIYGDGQQVRCLSPVQDILPCLVKLGLDVGLEQGHVWNLGPDTGEMTINQAYEMVQTLMDSDLAAEYLPGRPGEVKHATCSASKARAALGFEDKTPLAVCIKQMIDAVPEGGHPFRYDNYPLEIVSELTPKTWKERMM